VAEAIGRLMEFWGFKRLYGRLWATLYLSREELPAATLCERLGISAGAASMALSELERWGVVHRLGHEGERREYFRAETGLWKMISRVWREREQQEVERLIKALEEAVAALSEERPHGHEARAEARFRRERLQKLLGLAYLGRGLIAMALAGGLPHLAVLQETDLE
jgi:DNA-binding transcriptional regulator GbsR (MarR family)